MFAFEFVDARDRDIRSLKGRQPFRPAVRDCVASFDGVEEVFRKPFLDDFSFSSGASFKVIEPLVERALRFLAEITIDFRPRQGLLCFAGAITPGKVSDFFHQPNDSHHQPQLRVLIIFAAVVGDAHIAREIHQLLIARSFGQVISAPANAAREIADFDLHLSGKIALDPPLQSIAHTRRKADVQHIEFVGVSHRAQLNRSWIDQSVGPGKFEAVEPFAKSEHPRLANKSQIN